MLGEPPQEDESPDVLEHDTHQAHGQGEIKDDLLRPGLDSPYTRAGGPAITLRQCKVRMKKGGMRTREDHSKATKALSTFPLCSSTRHTAYAAMCARLLAVSGQEDAHS